MIIREWRDVQIKKNDGWVTTTGIVDESFLCQLPGCNRFVATGHGKSAQTHCDIWHSQQHRRLKNPRTLTPAKIRMSAQVLAVVTHTPQRVGMIADTLKRAKSTVNSALFRLLDQQLVKRSLTPNPLGGRQLVLWQLDTPVKN